MAMVCAIHKLENQDFITSGIFEGEFRDKHPRKWTNHALINFGKSTEACMVEVIAESH
jgi:hypothetical protein